MLCVDIGNVNFVWKNDMIVLVFSFVVCIEKCVVVEGWC